MIPCTFKKNPKFYPYGPEKLSKNFIAFFFSYVFQNEVKLHIILVTWAYIDFEFLQKRSWRPYNNEKAIFKLIP